MRILYFDIDSLRADHLGCYGYHRATSPCIDRMAAQGVRFNGCHVSDAPCLPSRTALFSGRFGIHNGVVNHGGTAAEMFNEGAGRDFVSKLGQTNWMRCLHRAGLHTATISSFGERHSAWHWYAGFNEVHNNGWGGLENADEVEPLALDWVQRQPDDSDNWFLHVNLWDPHTPYNTPAEFGEPFAHDPLPAWYTPEVLAKHRAGFGPHSACEALGFEADWPYAQPFPRQPHEIRSMEDARRMFDGYDTGVLYADQAIGRILAAVEKRGWLDDTWVIISSDHGENLGEFNIYGDHQTADTITSRVPLIIRPPKNFVGQRGRVDDSLIYQGDMAATMIELAGGTVPENWDAHSFTSQFKAAQPVNHRSELVLSQMAWSCQRSVRWADWLLMRSYHDGYHGFPPVMLFNVKADPHLQHDLAPANPAIADHGLALLDEWMTGMMATATHAEDPMRTVMLEGGPLHTRGALPAYLERLKATGRAVGAVHLALMHPRDAAGK
ncbi:MAG: sulfatase-like hydrolase/transferase [Cephaloticoccus sp.]|nr:sulfatase-like hydrolase/transferase [Cephaloticoccus sp.]